MVPQSLPHTCVMRVMTFCVEKFRSFYTDGICPPIKHLGKFSSVWKKHFISLNIFPIKDERCYT
jgi:hypothetical protein